ncbi:MAG: hypothetical protein IB618_03285 [Candidatus Pacearchaeota archaeon]|nr:MAG: hypothetical protein IB618_03285 [Candidatus Pacearchaeota archaeon]
MVSGLETAINLMLERTVDILKQPLINTEMLWILLPLLVALFLMELYFGRYKEEKLGWNSAVSNSIVLFFVGMNLASFLYSKNMLVGLTTVAPEVLEVASQKTFIAFIILLESIFLLVLNFFHLVSKRFAFGLSSALIMNYIGVISIVLIYSNIPINLSLLPAVLFLFIVTVLFFWILQFLEPKAEEEEEEEKEEESEEE